MCAHLAHVVAEISDHSPNFLDTPHMQDLDLFEYLKIELSVLVDFFFGGAEGFALKYTSRIKHLVTMDLFFKPP